MLAQSLTVSLQTFYLILILLEPITYIHKVKSKQSTLLDCGRKPCDLQKPRETQNIQTPPRETDWDLNDIIKRNTFDFFQHWLVWVNSRLVRNHFNFYLHFLIVRLYCSLLPKHEFPRSHARYHTYQYQKIHSGFEIKRPIKQNVSNNRLKKTKGNAEWFSVSLTERVAWVWQETKSLLC